MLEQSDFRSPTEKECADISRLAYEDSKSMIQYQKTLFWFFLAMMVLGPLYAIFGDTGFNGVEGTVVTVIILVVQWLFLGSFAFFFHKSIKKFENKIDVFARGQFYCVDGYVSRTEKSTRAIGEFIAVEFTTDGGRVLDGVCDVPSKGVAIGTRLLLVYIDKSFKLPIEDLMVVYTPAMLAGEAKILY